ncbi:MAG: right-handed parallel beta-helix repeat-containing protein, partial [Spirochaetaceae bacterium]|nr:right-handed parallel beta-helix repeat-containing protein [Spirochaetaceae bacterium]
NSSPVLTNVSVSGNVAATQGGGIYNLSSSSPVLSNVTISGNSANYGGGGMSNYGSSPVLSNVTVSGNAATGSGGGIYNNASSSLSLRNSIVWGNTAASGRGIYNDTSTSAIAYSIVEGSTGSLGSWSLSGCTNDGGNPADPGTGTANSPFADWKDPAISIPPQTGGDYRLAAGTNGDVAANAGDNSLYPPSAWAAWDTWVTTLTGSNPVPQTVFETYIAPALAKDLDGTARQNGAIDMGAYER